MDKIELPLTTYIKVSATGLFLAVAVLVALLPVVWPWRLTAIVLVVSTGIWLWYRYARRRPQSLCLKQGHKLVCVQASGVSVNVDAVHCGLISPLLISARLIGTGGEKMDLLVPGPSVDRETHWRLRRALIGWRPDKGDAERPSRF